MEPGRSGSRSGVRGRSGNHRFESPRNVRRCSAPASAGTFRSPGTRDFELVVRFRRDTAAALLRAVREDDVEISVVGPVGGIEWAVVDWLAGR